MDDRTGDILSLAEVFKKPKSEQKHFHEIPNSMIHEIEGMNRHERRRWLKLNRDRISIELKKEKSNAEHSAA